MRIKNITGVCMAAFLLLSSSIFTFAEDNTAQKNSGASSGVESAQSAATEDKDSSGSGTAVQGTQANGTKAEDTQTHKIDQKTQSEMERIMAEGFTKDQAFKIVSLLQVPACSKTEKEIKQMFKDGYTWEQIYKPALSSTQKNRKIPLTAQEIQDLCNQGYTYSEVKAAQEMYRQGKSESVKKHWTK